MSVERLAKAHLFSTFPQKRDSKNFQLALKTLKTEFFLFLHTYIQTRFKMRRLILVGCSLFLGSCIGTDYLNSPIMPERLTINTAPIALMVGEEKELTFSYFNKYGLPENTTPIWTVENPSKLTVNKNGLIQAKEEGTTKVYAMAASARDSVQVTIVSSIDQVAKVEITADNTTTSIGGKISFVGIIKTISNVVLQKAIIWKSTNPSVAIIDGTGTVTAQSNGTTVISGEADGVVSNLVTITVGATRQGMFVKSGGYEASGNTVLKLENEKLTLELADNFKTSFALGTFIYLSNNNSSGAAIKSGGLEIQQITRNGTHVFDVSSIQAGVKLSDYKYVIILCKPASVVFGYAELK